MSHPSSPPHVARFGRFSLDEGAGLLMRGRQPIPLRPKTFAVLCHLVARAGTLVSKEELLDAVWTDVIVGDDMPRLCVGELRRALGDDLGTPAYIVTVPRRGYRFVSKVETHAPRVVETVPDRAPGRDRVVLEAWVRAVVAGR